MDARVFVARVNARCAATMRRRSAPTLALTGAATFRILLNTLPMETHRIDERSSQQSIDLVACEGLLEFAVSVLRPLHCHHGSMDCTERNEGETNTHGSSMLPSSIHEYALEGTRFLLIVRNVSRS